MAANLGQTLQNSNNLMYQTMGGISQPNIRQPVMVQGGAGKGQRI